MAGEEVLKMRQVEWQEHKDYRDTPLALLGTTALTRLYETTRMTRRR